MKERCKKCSLYESKTCVCWDCDGICKSTTPSLGERPHKVNNNDDDKTFQQPRKKCFADLKNEITYLSDLEIRCLADLVNQEMRNRMLRKRNTRRAKLLKKKQQRNAQA